MKQKIIYGVFAVQVELPKLSNSKQEIKNLAESMKQLGEENQRKAGHFVRAYERLESAVEDCYHANGWLLTRTNEGPDNVTNGSYATYYFPRVIEVICEH